MLQIFFTERAGLNPIQLQCIYIALPAVVSLFTIAVTKISKKVGRMQVIVPTNLCGIAFTFTLAFCEQYYHVPTVIIPIYLLRCGCMWCTGGLAYSIIADYVPKKYRARWNTLESIASFGWSGSALLGGKLVEMYDYNTTFAITGILQLLALVVFYLPLVPLVAKEEDIKAWVKKQKEQRGEGGEGEGDASRELEEPLLAKPTETIHIVDAVQSDSFRGLPGLNPTFAEARSSSPTIAGSLGHLEHIARAGDMK